MRIQLIAAVLLLTGCAHSPSYDPQDPLEPMNRRVYAFNQKVDQYVAKPLAETYVAATPDEFRSGIHNFLSNLAYVRVIANDLLQAKFVIAGRDSTRLLMNTTFGLAGFLDPATLVGLERRSEDFGQTLGYWGVGEGWFLMLPFLGPTTNRDLVGQGGDYFTNPMELADIEGRRSLAYQGMTLVDLRSSLLGTEGVLREQFDPYVFLRGIYLQRRQNLIYDGNPPPEDDFEDEDEGKSG
ncbi:VacJ family lipoprotein [Solimonas sp. K1W22B-7]|uniref:MlaA family lipoprotein n=1 Tax=Solimonas sp. K1W22B-7 TaxID=2303331 RepID=UPI000E334E82|nr:VacJ family lipoprotein [Solimonas sp. K1W22B-7]AXQ30289.1 VacJ family lipoprotein [Solimonas sp. K1W22B-7]